MGYTVQVGDAQVDEAKLADLCRRYGIRELSLFGSAVRGEMRSDSDIDVMVEFEANARIGLLKFESLSEDLEALLGRKVDLVTKRGLKPWVRPQVLKEARVIYEAEASYLQDILAAAGKIEAITAATSARRH